MIRVLIADDQALIRAGFAALINSAPDLEVVGEAIDGADALRRCTTLLPDVVLMDIRMPGLDGLQATEQITANPDLDGVISDPNYYKNVFHSHDYVRRVWPSLGLEVLRIVPGCIGNHYDLVVLQRLG